MRIVQAAAQEASSFCMQYEYPSQGTHFQVPPGPFMVSLTLAALLSLYRCWADTATSWGEV